MAVLAVVAGVCGAIAQAAPGAGAVDRVSIPDGGGERNVLPTGSSLQCNAQNAGKCTKHAVAVGTDGKVRAVFASAANNIVANDNNGHSDIFLTTLTPSATVGAAPTIDSVERINLGPAGVEANGESQGASISPDGSWVSFDSTASNLVNNDNNAANDVFVYHVADRAMYRASVAKAPATEGSGGSFASSVANDGSVSFTSYNALVPGATTTFQQVYVRRTPATAPDTVLASINTGGTSSGDAPSLESTITAAGDKVAFTTNADDVVPTGAKTKGIPDIAVRTLNGTPTTRLASHDAKAGAGTISADGTQVAFIAELIGAKKGIYQVSTSGMAGAGDMKAECTSASCANKPKAAVLPSLSGNGSVLTFQSASKYNDLPINSDQIWVGAGSNPVLVSQEIATGKQATNGAANPSVSADGRWIVFESAAENLVGDDYNGSTDIFLAQVGATAPSSMTRVSVPVAGGEASGFAAAPGAPPAVSADGNVIAFESDSSNLVAGDTNGVPDILVRDRAAGRTERVSIASDGTQSNAGSFKPGISGDGRFVVFESAASNLLAGGADANGVVDVFLRDRQTGETKRISDTPGSTPSRNPSISANGTYIAFESNGNFGPITSTHPEVTNIFRYGSPASGGDGAFLMVSTQPPSGNSPNRKASGKSSYDPSVANDGSVAFLSDSTGLTGFDGDDPAGAKPNYTDVYVALPSGTVVKASMSNTTYQAPDGSAHQAPATGDSYRPSISADGTKVAFGSDATNLPTAGADQNPDTDVFLRDIPGNAVRLVDQPPSGVPGGASTAPAVSADGSAVAFVSSAPNLVPGDTNGAPDVFLANAGNGGINRISVRPGVEGFQPDGPSYLPSISANGLVTAFGSSASNLVDGDQNHAYDVFVRTLTELPGPCTGCKAGGPTYSGPGYRFVSADGGIFSFGDAKFYGSAGGTKLAKPIVGMLATPTNAGYWLVASDGGIFSYGDAKFLGSTGAIHLNSPIVGMAATPTGQGYWFVAADGGIFSFGDAKFFGSMGGQPLSRPIVGMASTASGRGYWLVASDGGIFAYGDAKFYGSTGNIKLAKPIVGMDRTVTGNGYRFVSSDGGIFSFGDAKFLGSMGGKPLKNPIVGMARTRSGDGYWMVSSDGGIFNFGAAGFQGSAGDVKLAHPIVSMAS